MCVAAPMKVISVDEVKHTARVMYCGNEMDVNISLVSPGVGDYVLVHAGCAIQIVGREEAEEILDAFKMLGDISNGA